MSEHAPETLPPIDFAEELRQLVGHYRLVCREQGNAIEFLNAKLTATEAKLAKAELSIADLYEQIHGRPLNPRPTP